MSSLVTSLIRELDIFFGFSWRDWSASIIPGSIHALCALRASDLTLSTAPYRVLLLYSWLTCYIYWFNLSNQITGVAEDSVNKPDRPIPSGKVTLDGAKKRWAVMTCVYIAVCAIEPALIPETVCWMVTTAFLSLTPGGSHWVGKNGIAMTTGTWSLLGGSWKAINPVIPIDQRWIVCFSCYVGFLVNTQDLRDTSGDRAVGRKTMPVSFGDFGCRLILTFLFIPAATWLLWYGRVLAPAPMTTYLLHGILGYRIMRGGGVRADHKTYMYYTYMFCTLLACESIKDLRPEERAIDALKGMLLSTNGTSSFETS